MPPERKRRIAVLGAGAWGTALANLAARGGDGHASVVLWTKDPAHADEMRATGVNARRLPGIPLLSGVNPTAEPAEIEGAEFVLAAVPAQALRPVLETFAQYIEEGAPVIICAKGFERATGQFLSEAASALLPKNPPAVLSGPSFAKEVAQGLPTAVTLAAHDGALAAKLAAALASPSFRLYSSSDVRGVEIGGAAKNVLAIASGTTAGRGLGASAGAALIARGFAELSRFGRAYGAETATLAGLSGLGDLVLTCTGDLSRNRTVGIELAGGRKLDEIVSSMKMVAEGIKTTDAAVELAARHGVEMPIAGQMFEMLHAGASPQEAIRRLMERSLKGE